MKQKIPSYLTSIGTEENGGRFWEPFGLFLTYWKPVSCFSCFFSHFSIDASKEDGSLGRLVNDDYKSPNCKIKKIGVGGKPHLCLFSIKDIASGEEITYNYGDSNWPWRTLVIGSLFTLSWCC